jgi:CsoR family transcriptional regulator, copper-sensing transcriptional repressor
MRAMDENDKASIIKRLKNVAGHVNGIVAMVEQDRYCIDIVKQLQAAQAALAKTNQLMLDMHLHTCLTTAIRGDDPAERERVLSEISEIFATIDW